MSTEHIAQTIRGARIPGTWVSVCSCGWRGELHGFAGARQVAIADRQIHVADAEDAARCGPFLAGLRSPTLPRGQ